MSNSKKREFTDHDNSLISPIQLKKRKLSESVSTNKIKSIFSNSSDHNEFLTYFHPIQQSPLSKLLNIPFDINREIAQYAVGTIQKCANTNCNAGICVLNEHWIEFNPLKWNYCANKNKYFCDMCLPFTTHFICCDTIQYFKHYTKCFWLNKNETMCYDDVWDVWDEYVMGYKCLYCDNMSNNDHCARCNEWNCALHDTMKCDAGIHNICCSEVYCIECENCFCIPCNGYDCGHFCDRCNGFWCNVCA
eukprot:390260_1